MSAFCEVSYYLRPFIFSQGTPFSFAPLNSCSLSLQIQLCFHSLFLHQKPHPFLGPNFPFKSPSPATSLISNSAGQLHLDGLLACQVSRVRITPLSPPLQPYTLTPLSYTSRLWEWHLHAKGQLLCHLPPISLLTTFWQLCLLSWSPGTPLLFSWFLELTLPHVVPQHHNHFCARLTTSENILLLGLLQWWDSDRRSSCPIYSFMPTLPVSLGISESNKWHQQLLEIARALSW